MGHNGVLTAEEVQKTLKEQKWPDEDIENFMELAKNENGQVQFEAFMAMMLSTMAAEEVALAERVFHEADEDKSGHLSREEIKKLLERKTVVKIMGRRKAADVLKEMDADADGQVSLEEFKAVLCLR